jgi:DNA-binding NarL/FixJ family response regulator
VRRLCADGHRVLLYTNDLRPAVLACCLAAGALGVIHKSESMPKLVEAVESVARGRQFVTARVAGLLKMRGELETMGFGLTTRETEVLRLRASGLANQVIADRLNISLKTLESHVRSVCTKYEQYLCEHSETELAQELGISNDLVDPKDLPRRSRR